ncbi:hypothetical protein Hte_011951 [Hypoxylon texense]
MASNLIGIRSEDGVTMVISRQAAELSEQLVKEQWDGLSDTEIEETVWQINFVNSDTLEKIVIWCERYCENEELRSLMAGTPTADWTRNPKIISAFLPFLLDKDEFEEFQEAALDLYIEPIMKMTTALTRWGIRDVDIAGAVPGLDTSQERQLCSNFPEPSAQDTSSH